MATMDINHCEMQRPEGYPSDEQDLGDMSSIVSDMERSPLFGGDNDLSLLERGLYRRTYSDMGDNHHRIQESAKRLGKSFDPRVLVLLEFFGEFYVRSQELLKQIFPGLRNEFIEFFKKVGTVLAKVKSNQVKVKTMQRSLSLGSPLMPSKKEDESSLRLERFKIRTVNIGDVQEGGQSSQGGQGGQGGTKPAGSK
ncbi:PREDICTED: uncharacterized protein LOC18586776 [Theobroma cacao]|uniref:Uncharacterized protein LOC18586776 n=1 Tax=Theobroma cacao TaxID=3641 RepID=A0AB32WZ48_THECC|nr:PREDICTED: uncharacterized protein LOC18586776 [Theobroma cacao]